jgi:hypothetical protein
LADPLPKYARVDTTNPESYAQCDRCGLWFNRSDLVFQVEWAGMSLYSTGALVCTVGPKCFDLPQEQLRTIILPPDPPPIINARVPNFDYEEQTVIQIQFGGTSKINNMSPPWQAGPQMALTLEGGSNLALLYQYPDIVQIS